MEGPLAMTECSIHTSQCGIEDTCGVRANWRRINDVVADALRSVSLAQMLSPPVASPMPHPLHHPSRHRDASTCAWPGTEITT